MKGLQIRCVCTCSVCRFKGTIRRTGGKERERAVWKLSQRVHCSRVASRVDTRAFLAGCDVANGTQKGSLTAACTALKVNELMSLSHQVGTDLCKVARVISCTMHMFGTECEPRVKHRGRGQSQGLRKALVHSEPDVTDCTTVSQTKTSTNHTRAPRYPTNARRTFRYCLRQWATEKSNHGKVNSPARCAWRRIASPTPQGTTAAAAHRRPRHLVHHQRHLWRLRCRCCACPSCYPSCLEASCHRHLPWLQLIPLLCCAGRDGGGRRGDLSTAASDRGTSEIATKKAHSPAAR